jgi:hypothetical protein
MSSPMLPPEIDAPAPDGDVVPPLAFGDAEAAKRWLRDLPLANVTQAARALLGQLHALAIADIAPRERATIAEILRDQIAHLHTELARRYAGRALPAEGRELEAGDVAIALWQELWGQYSACLEPLLDGVEELSGVKPKLLQRGIYVGKQLVLVHGLARRALPPALWHELHAYYRLAEILECAVTAVSDNLIPNAVGISCYSTYSHALLLGLADPCAMSVKQIELADRWLAMWARKVFPYAQQRETEGPVIAVDLDGSTGAALAAVAPRSPSPAMRYGYPGKLATSVRGRLKRLQSGANPAELQLGHDCSAEQCTTLLGHLDAHWYQAPRQEPPADARGVELCTGALPAAYFRAGGRTFLREDVQRQRSFNEALRLKTLDVVASHDPGREAAERTWPWERWDGSCDARGATLARTEDTQHRWQLEQLVMLRTDAAIHAGFVTRVAAGADGGYSLALRAWAGEPRAIALRPQSPAVDEPALPALLLAETPDDKACLVLPPRTFSPSRLLLSADALPVQRFRLTRLLQRGADFERVAFEALPA